jgi:hypothetical protein
LQCLSGKLFVRCKVKRRYTYIVRQHPIKANPAKAGDAKLWVYRRESDNDRQAAKDHRSDLYFGLALEARLFYWIGQNLQMLFDNGKPDESRRRKATGLPLVTARTAGPPKTTPYAVRSGCP